MKLYNIRSERKYIELKLSDKHREIKVNIFSTVSSAMCRLQLMKAFFNYKKMDFINNHIVLKPLKIGENL